MSEKRIPIQITITGDRVDKLADIWGKLLSEKGTKAVINLELINSAIDRFHKKLFKPGDINKLKREHAKAFDQVIKTMGTPENE